jgi:hypothetical protein
MASTLERTKQLVYFPGRKAATLILDFDQDAAFGR